MIGHAVSQGLMFTALVGAHWAIGIGFTFIALAGYGLYCCGRDALNAHLLSMLDACDP